MQLGAHASGSLLSPKLAGERQPPELNLALYPLVVRYPRRATHRIVKKAMGRLG